VGGIEAYLSLVIPALSAAGHQVAFWHERDEPVDRDRIGVPPDIMDISGAASGPDAAIAALRDWRPDVTYVQGLHDPEIESRLLDVAPAMFFLHTYVGTCISGAKMFTRPAAVPCSRQFGWPCLLHYFPHGCGGHSPITMWQQFQSQSDRLQLLRRYKAIVTHSDHMRDEMVRHGLQADVIPFPVAAQIGCEAASDMKVGDGAWRLLYAGRMEFLKGGLLLIEALPEIVRRSKRPVKLILAGDGRDRKRWEAKAQEIVNSTPNLMIEFRGWLPQQDVGGLLTNVDLLVVPSLWPEPFGSVGPAAGQHGVPAAAFASGGIPQWLIEGVSGHLAAHPPTAAGLAGAVLRCLGDPRHYSALRNGAREIAARFTMEHHLPALTRALERVKGLDGRS
jgi:glycosyltransferase involved in cell wall biosynthesis